MTLSIEIDKASAVALHEQLAEQLRRAIVGGDIGRGQKVPSTRELARQLGVARGSVTKAYDELLRQGYLRTVDASGTFVNDRIPDQFLQTTANVPQTGERRKPYTARLTPLAQRLSAMVTPDYQSRMDAIIQQVMPEEGQFPFHAWRRLIHDLRRSSGHQLLTTGGDPRGDLILREALAEYLVACRGSNAEPSRF
jgi:GntR family transcriptional regulator/MocR family aminotransferase